METNDAVDYSQVKVEYIDRCMTQRRVKSDLLNLALHVVFTDIAREWCQDSRLLGSLLSKMKLLADYGVEFNGTLDDGSSEFVVELRRTPLARFVLYLFTDRFIEGDPREIKDILVVSYLHAKNIPTKI